MHAVSPLIAPQLFDMPPDVLWLSHCKDGPLPRASAETVRALLDTELRPWDLRWNEDFLDVQRSLRDISATLLGVDAQDMSLVTCTSTGLEVVALGYPWQHGDEVVIPAGEFPSNRLPWLSLARRGVTYTEIALWEGQSARAPDAGIEPEQRLLDAITPRTRVIAVSWVRYQDGVRLDLNKLGRGCRERGVHLVVDGIQGAGTVASSFDGVSAFSTGGHKGLLGLQGQGLLWTDRTFRQQLIPLGTWLSAPDDFSQSGTQTQSDEPWATDGRRLEAGSPSILSCAALASSIRLLVQSGGAASIQAHVAQLQRSLLAMLAADAAWAVEAGRLGDLLAAGKMGSILSFAVPLETSARLLNAAQTQGISASTREGYLRIAFHGWHGSSDVERCAAWLLSSPG
ncbi:MULTISPECIES: aminotransferase class V-fold PLP-dependent enzyme [unclassified Dyella]|uniref:aminotransferase class V-fold PLP-dependent enzyme n=1 Tax=unclassified Dyella TaxID=2634549 RepID=UPI000C82B33E|nr:MULTISPECIES: aminotransferase class V-fold PLP-dependent enzyme [unclassified Dyella]MDR3446394.1 aminotransferase class V-fold PLP-dependent enzyme [Dyella sp.]PMQ04445.1 Cysteine desulfurase CsdA [Dyella sp. AD56]